MHSSIRWGLAAASLVCLAVGCTALSSENEGAAAKAVSAESSESASTSWKSPHDNQSVDGAFKFYLVSLDHTGYGASELGAPFSVCPDGYLRTQCHLDDLDFSLLDMAKGDIAAVRAQVVSEPKASTLVFVGALNRSHYAGKGMLTMMQVKEMWRAPAVGTVHASDTWFHVSHTPMQALEVNRWTTPNVASLDLSAAPWFSDCDPDDAGVVICAPSQDGVLEDAATETGILVDGTLDRNGVLHVAQYMAKITVGALHEDNGYWYCHPEQLQCSTGFCSSTGNCMGLQFHGPVLNTIYIRSQAQDVQPWLIQTTQLTAAESADLVSRKQL